MREDALGYSQGGTLWGDSLRCEFLHKRDSLPVNPYYTLFYQSVNYLENRIQNLSNQTDLIRTSPRPISDTPLSVLPHLHLCPIYLIVSQGSYSYDGISHLEGGFTLRCLQRLSLPDLATLLWRWSPTGTPVVRPSRSSRTKDSSSQISYAHAG